jgi:hypothetical protein
MELILVIGLIYVGYAVQDYLAERRVKRMVDERDGEGAYDRLKHKR